MPAQLSVVKAADEGVLDSLANWKSPMIVRLSFSFFFFGITSIA